MMNPRHPLLPVSFPESWVESYGQDDYGLWQGFYIDDIETRLRWIPPGEFLMGSRVDEPRQDGEEGQQNLARFEHGFWLAETACSKALWQAVMGENPSPAKSKGRPVERVSWIDSNDFIAQLNQLKLGLRLRLPSEEEWEYAYRAGRGTFFLPGSELITDQEDDNVDFSIVQVSNGVSQGDAMLVKVHQRNPWGLSQLRGNVWEWCEDWCHEHEGAPAEGRSRLSGGNQKGAVLRSGSWFNRGRHLRTARLCARRNRVSDYFGFRLARDSELPHSL